jgi:hypothetical protein
MEALPGQSVGFQSAGRTTPAYEKNRQQNGVPAEQPGNRSDNQQKKITEECTVNGGLKKTFRCKLSGARETERERQRDNSLLDAHMQTHRVTARAHSAQRT